MDAYSMPTISGPISNQSIGVAVQKYPHLYGLKLADSPSMSGDVDVDILFGADYYWKFVMGATKHGQGPGPVAVLTRLGWVLSGPVIDCSQSKRNCSINLNATHNLRVDAEQLCTNPDRNLHAQLEMFWKLETLGVQNKEQTDDTNCLDEIKFDGKHYEVKCQFDLNIL